MRYIQHLLRMLLDDGGSPGAPLPSARGRVRVQPEEEALPVAVHPTLRLAGVRVLHSTHASIVEEEEVEKQGKLAQAWDGKRERKRNKSDALVRTFRHDVKCVAWFTPHVRVCVGDAGWDGRGRRAAYISALPLEVFLHTTGSDARPSASAVNTSICFHGTN